MAYQKVIIGKTWKNYVAEGKFHSSARNSWPEKL